MKKTESNQSPRRRRRRLQPDAEAPCGHRPEEEEEEEEDRDAFSLCAPRRRQDAPTPSNTPRACRHFQNKIGMDWNKYRLIHTV